MAFQLTRLNVPSLTTDYSAETNAAAQLGKTLGDLVPNMRKQELEAQKQQLLGSLTGGGADYNKVGLGLLALGDTQGGAAVLGLGQKAKEQERESEWMKNNAGVLGNAQPSAAPVAGPASLIQNESGGNWQAQNNATGAGGAKGHFGRLQFGQARLQEAAAAGAIPPGTTPQQFMASPELQQRAEQWHFGDIDQSIKQNGYDRLVGQSIGGVPVTVDGMRAVAHLGGKEGLRKFIETQGAYNPADENGTRLSDYFARHGGGGQPAQTQTAQAPAGVPQSGGTYAGVPAERLQQFIENPRVPENLRALMRQELAGRQGDQTGQPVQVAQAPGQPGAPVSDVPAQGAAQAQFLIPGTTPGQTASIMADKQVQNYLRALDGAPDKFKAGIQKRLEIRVEELKQARGDDARGVDTDLKRAQLEKARRENAGEVPAPAGYRYKPGTTELEAIPGGPAFSKTPAAEVESRKAAAERAGVTPTDPRYQSYVLTGKTPREDAQPLSATDKKAILEADEGVLSGETAIRALNEAKGLSKQAMSGPTAGLLAKAGNNLPDWMVPDFIASPGASEATANLENTVTANALTQMKSIFGGNPTEGERKILLDIQGSIGQPDNVRQGIYDRAIRAAEARLAFNKQRASELRGGDYYKSPDKQGQAQPQRQQQAPAIQGGRVAPDGNTYVPDPNRPGKYLMVQP